MRARAVFAVIVLPEVTVMIVGVQNGDGVGFILSVHWRPRQQRQETANAHAVVFSEKRMADLRVLNGFYDEGEIVARINDS